MITYTIECKDAAHVRRVELALQSADLISKIDKSFADSRQQFLSPARLRLGLRDVIKFELNVDPAEFGLKPIEEVAP